AARDLRPRLGTVTILPSSPPPSVVTVKSRTGWVGVVAPGPGNRVRLLKQHQAEGAVRRWPRPCDDSGYGLRSCFFGPIHGAQVGSLSMRASRARAIIAAGRPRLQCVETAAWK